jgi:hypothetical protein
LSCTGAHKSLIIFISFSTAFCAVARVLHVAAGQDSSTYPRKQLQQILYICSLEAQDDHGIHKLAVSKLRGAYVRYRSNCQRPRHQLQHRPNNRSDAAAHQQETASKPSLGEIKD